MPNSGAIDAALVAKLTADATLTTLAPGGVFREVAPQGVSEPYVIVQQMTSEDQYLLNKQQAWESYQWMVKAVQAANTGAAAQLAADRVQALLQNGTLSATGYTLMLLQREERIAYVEIDDHKDRRYQHRGGLYRVMVEAA